MECILFFKGVEFLRVITYMFYVFFTVVIKYLTSWWSAIFMFLYVLTILQCSQHNHSVETPIIFTYGKNNDSTHFCLFGKISICQCYFCKERFLACKSIISQLSCAHPPYITHPPITHLFTSLTNSQHHPTN